VGLEVADIFRRHGDAYRQAHDGHMGRVERRVGAGGADKSLQFPDISAIRVDSISAFGTSISPFRVSHSTASRDADFPPPASTALPQRNRGRKTPPFLSGFFIENQ
jgi:hypothetical protein